MPQSLLSRRLALMTTGRVALEEVFLECRKDLERVMRRRTGSGDTATDLLHDIYLKCRNVEEEFPDRQQARAYLLRMASNLAIDHVRVAGRRAVILGDMMPVYDAFDRQADTPEAHALAAEKVRQIEAVLNRLPGQTREMFVLVRLYGLTHKEVAERLGVSKSLVDKYVLQALLRCRDALGGLDALD